MTFLPRILLSTALQRAAMFVLLAAAGGTSAWSAVIAPCNPEGQRTATAAYTVPGMIPANFGVSGPKDLDAISEPDNDLCKTFYFYVPKVNYEGKTGPGGWGGLVITFDRLVDGASFIFDPGCPVPIQGELAPEVIDAFEVNSFRFSSATKYGFLPTDSPVKNDGIYSPFVVTVMYDPTGPDDGGPNIVYGPDDAPLSFWQGKPSKQGFGFAGVDGFAPLRVPEPSTLLLFAAGLSGLGFLRRRRRA